MKSICAITVAIFATLLFVSPTESRKGPAGEYWSEVMKDQPMPKAIQGLISHKPDSPTNTNCLENHGFTDEFEPVPNASAYPNDHHRAKAFTDEFEPVPNTTAYPNDHRHAKAFTDEFEPVPNVTAYPNDHHRAKAFTDEFEPVPNISAYPDGHKADTQASIAKG